MGGKQICWGREEGQPEGRAEVERWTQGLEKVVGASGVAAGTRGRRRQMEGEKVKCSGGVKGGSRVGVSGDRGEGNWKTSKRGFPGKDLLKL